MPESPIIKAVREKTERLIADNRKLRKELGRVGEQKERLKAERSEMAERIAQMEKRIAVLELKEGMSGNAEDPKLASARVNRLMREVDKCIALLNR